MFVRGFGGLVASGRSEVHSCYATMEFAKAESMILSEDHTYNLQFTLLSSLNGEDARVNYTVSAGGGIKCRNLSAFR